MYYFIYAKEGMYEGLHGIYDYTLYDAASYEDACDTAEGMSRDVIDSYVRPEDVYYTQEDFCEEQGYDEWDESYWGEYYDMLDEIISGYISYEVYPLKDGVTEADYKAWQKENLEPEDFIRRYCRELTEEDCK